MVQAATKTATQGTQKGAAMKVTLPFGTAAYALVPQAGSTLPFLPSRGGGAAAEATVSPLFLAKPPGDVGAQAGDAQTTVLQAGLAITGSGAKQTSAIELAVGRVPENAKLRDGELAGAVRGTSHADTDASTLSFGPLASRKPSATTASFAARALPTQIALDNATFDGAGKASAAPATVDVPGANPVSTAYGYDRVFKQVAAPADLGKARTTQTLAGYANGVVESHQTGGVDDKSVVATGNTPGGMSLTHVAASNRMTAQMGFARTDTLGGGPNGAGTATLEFGSLSAPQAGASSFVDDKRFAAAEGYSVGSTGALTPRSTTNGATVQESALYLVSSAVAPLPAAMTATAPDCVCEYVRWGWWGGGTTTAGAKAGTTRNDIINLGTWVAGSLTSPADMPQIGTAHYTGMAVGTVVNGKAQYVANGVYTQDVDFAKRSGSLAIRNFDGVTYAGTISGSRDFQGSLANVTAAGAKPTITGSVAGSYYGTGPAAAAEVGGQFRVGNGKTGAAAYAATGVMVGRR